jgi:hypothetical protein
MEWFKELYDSLSTFKQIDQSLKNTKVFIHLATLAVGGTVDNRSVAEEDLKIFAIYLRTRKD